MDEAYLDFLRSRLEEFYSKICTSMTSMAKKYGVSITAIPPNLSDEDVELFFNRSIPKIYDNEIESAFILLTQATAPVVQAILGVQGGKTNSMILYIMLKRIVATLKGENLDYLYLLPSDKSIGQMTDASFSEITSFLEKINFKNCVNECSYYDLVMKAFKERGAATDGNGLFDRRINSMTNNKKNINKIKKIMENATKESIKQIISWDESHYAENRGSIAERILGDDVYNAAKEGNHQLLMLSATPYPWLSLEKVQKVSLKLGAGYTGFNFIDGKPIDADAPIVTPVIRPFPGGIPLSPLAAFSRKRFDKLKRKYDELAAVDTPQEYFQILIDEIVKLLQSEIIAGKTGSVCRFVCNNYKTKTIMDEIHKRLPDVFLIPYFDDMGYEDMQNQITEAHKRFKRPFIICVSGRARMSNRFPKEVQVFIDFTQTYSNATSAVQGLPGRAAGYYGQRTVYMTPENSIEFEKFIYSLGTDGFKKRHSRTKKNGKSIYRSSMKFYPNDPRCKCLYDAVEGLVGSRIKSQVDAGKKKPRGTRVDKDVIFSQFPELEANYGITGMLLREGQVPEYAPKNITNDEKGSYMLNVDKDGVFLAFRATNHRLRLVDRRGNLRSRTQDFKTTSIRQDKKKQRGVEPHIHIDMVSGKIKLIELPLNKKHKDGQNDIVHLPTEQSMASALLPSSGEQNVGRRA